MNTPPLIYQSDVIQADGRSSKHGLAICSFLDSLLYERRGVTCSDFGNQGQREEQAGVERIEHIGQGADGLTSRLTRAMDFPLLIGVFGCHGDSLMAAVGIVI